MLKSLTVGGFKSLIDVGPIEMAPLTVFFGPNAAGKSNLLDAILLLSRLATARTVAEALEGPVRGLPLELFSFPEEQGLPGLLAKKKATLRLETDFTSRRQGYRYAVELAITPASGTVTVDGELLVSLTPRGKIRGKPFIERHGDGLSHALISNGRYSGKEHAVIERARDVLSSFRSYYLDPRTAMRQPQPPREVDDIGPLGEHIAPFLYRLRAERPKIFASIQRTLCTLIPSVDDLVIDLDSRRGVLTIEIQQGKTPFSSRIVSEGTLRVLALICVATNPWGGSLVAFEEPENGVHPRRIELIAEILGSLALGEGSQRQVVLTTHSPLFCSSVMKLAKRHPEKVFMYRTVREGGKTLFQRFEPMGPLFEDHEVRDALTAPAEDAVFEGLLLRGLLDG